MKKILFFKLLIIISTVLVGQNYQINTPYVNILKNTNYGVLHHYIQIDNLINQDFGMRWVALTGNPSSCPSGWVVGVGDPDSTYVTYSVNDSADFILSGTNPTYNKITISITHNGIPGSCLLNFKVYELSNPQNYTNIGFDVFVSQGTTSIESVKSKKDVIGYPNPVNNIYYFNKKVIRYKLFSLDGKFICEGNNSSSIDLTNIKEGTYLLLVETANGEYINDRIIKN